VASIPITDGRNLRPLENRGKTYFFFWGGQNVISGLSYALQLITVVYLSFNSLAYSIYRFLSTAFGPVAQLFSRSFTY